MSHFAPLVALVDVVKSGRMGLGKNHLNVIMGLECKVDCVGDLRFFHNGNGLFNVINLPKKH